MIMLRAVIIEDEALSRDTLRNYVEEYCSDVALVGEAPDIEEGKKIIIKHKPDLVFLDVEMPFGNGFDLLESLDDTSFEVIFVTAFSHYAIRAIQYSASNYLLKPIDIDELIAAVEKVKKQDGQKVAATKILLENLRNTQVQSTKIVLPVLDGFEIIQSGEISHCVASDNFTNFRIASGKQLLICRTLKHYQEILEPLGFLRIHKSYLINLEKVRKYIKGKGGFVIMENEEEIPVSPASKATLLNALSGRAI